MTSAPHAQAPVTEPGTGPTAGHEPIIRDATPDDMAAIQGIYAQHVLQGTATFEEIPPSVQDMRARYAAIVAQGMPYLVAQIGDQIAGYCYANAYRPRVAYRYTLEDSIYLAEGQTGRGLGRALLTALIARCEQGPWRQMIAVIGGNNNTASISLHRSLGFAHVGTQPATGFKFNQWLDVIFMQRALGPGGDSLPDVTPPQTA